VIDAFNDVLPEFLGLLAFFGLVAGLTWIWNRVRGEGSVVSECATPPRNSEPVKAPRPIPLYRGGYQGSPLPDPLPKAPKAPGVLPPNAQPIDDAVAEFLYRDMRVERPKV
jgi:hypothetical protein